MTSSLSAWSTNPSLNKGWLIRYSGTNGTELRSSEYATVSVRPKLVVYYNISNLAADQPILVAPLNLAIGVSTSPSLQVSITDPETDNMTVTFHGRPVVGPPPNNYVVVGTNPGVMSGSTTSMTWPGLSPVTAYEWYVTLNDGFNTTTGPVWTFTTAGTVPVITSTAVTAGVVGQAYSYDVNALDIFPRRHLKHFPLKA